MSKKVVSAAMNFSLQNSYYELPERFYEKAPQLPVFKPKLLAWNQTLAEEFPELHIAMSDDEKAAFFSGQKISPEMKPLAQAYSGHQFGHFSPQLGDGRALLLGDIANKQGQRKDVHLKGSGPTRFSRRGDGMATLHSVIREYIVSEGMYRLGVPTSRSLAIIGTGQTVYREEPRPGAILVRIAESHVRVGTFEYFAARGDVEALELLAKFVTHRHYPFLLQNKNPYAALLEQIVDKQARLVSHWLRFGFIHGVMNTDNMFVSGETLDYGPCAFMEAYDSLKVYSSIDHRGRYAYARQPEMAQWNLNCLAYCLIPLIDENKEKAQTVAEEIIASFQGRFQTYWLRDFGNKIGITSTEKDVSLIQEFLQLMQKNKADFTLSFRSLSKEITERSDENAKSFFAAPEWREWFLKWRSRLKEERGSLAELQKKMNEVNPIYIPRNHLVEQAIQEAAIKNDFSPMNQLLEAFASPYSENNKFTHLARPAKPEELVQETFCGT
jgi:serine/tyrosine/threonine adenylyltransferase